MKVLHFTVRGDSYSANEAGHIRRNDMPSLGFSPTWILLGVSTHHWHQSVKVPLAAIFADPKQMLKGYVWDRDHGATRTWMGSGNPRVTSAFTTEEK